MIFSSMVLNPLFPLKNIIVYQGQNFRRGIKRVKVDSGLFLRVYVEGTQVEFQTELNNFVLQHYFTQYLYDENNMQIYLISLVNSCYQYMHVVIFREKI